MENEGLKKPIPEKIQEIYKIFQEILEWILSNSNQISTFDYRILRSQDTVKVIEESFDLVLTLDGSKQFTRSPWLRAPRISMNHRKGVLYHPKAVRTWCESSNHFVIYLCVGVVIVDN